MAAPLMILCGYCAAHGKTVEMTTVPSGTKCCPACGRIARPDGVPMAPPAPQP